MRDQSPAPGVPGTPFPSHSRSPRTADPAAPDRLPAPGRDYPRRNFGDDDADEGFDLPDQGSPDAGLLLASVDGQAGVPGTSSDAKTVSGEVAPVAPVPPVAVAAGAAETRWGLESAPSSPPDGYGNLSWYALGVGGAALASGAGGDGGATAAPATAPADFKIVVRDERLKDAEVFIDRNGDGAVSADEKLGRTDESGELKVSDATLSGTLIVKEGQNGGGEPNPVTLKLYLGDAHARVGVVSTLTTLAAAVYESGRNTPQPPSRADAEATVKHAFGLADAVSLSTYEPPAGGSAEALAVARAGAELSLLGKDALLSGTAFAAIASHLRNTPGALLDLADATTLKTIFHTLGDSAAALLEHLAASNGRIAAAASVDEVAARLSEASTLSIAGLLADTGSSASDRITATPHLLIVGQRAGTTLEYSLDGGALWSDRYAPADGAVTVIVRQRYLANDQTSGHSEAFSFVLDATPPPPLTIRLKADSGVSASDGVTRGAEFVVSGQTAGSRVEYSADHAAWSASPPVAKEGAQTIYVRQVDTLSGAASPVTPLRFTLDRHAEVGTLALDAESDSGPLATDGITQVTRPVFRGAAEPGVTAVVLTLGDKTYTVSEIDAASGHWTFAVPDPLVDGTYSPLLQVSDAAGNTSAPTVMAALVIDTTPPDEGSSQLAAGSDSGQDHEDGVTSVTRPTLTGIAEAGARVSVEVDGTVYDTETDFAGRWSITVTGALDEGEYTPSITLFDRAGNEGDAFDGGTFTILTHGLEILTPAGLMAEEDYDTGPYSDDGFTSNPLPLIFGELSLGGVAVVLRFAGQTYATVTDDAGAWSIQIPEDFELEEGSYLPAVMYLDAAGNQTVEQGRPVVIDLTPPEEADAWLVHDDESDTGADAEDGLTGNDSPWIEGTAEPGALVVLDLNGNTFEDIVADADGYWKTQVYGLEDGEYTPLLTIIDLAGNLAEEIEASTSFIVDLTGPEEDALSGALVHDEDNDTGVDPEDGITANSRPNFAGTAEPRALVTLLIDDLAFTGEADGDGAWTIEPDVDLPDGEYLPVISVADAVGNVTELDFELPVIIDSESPDASTVNVELSPDSDSGLADDDGITQVTAPTLVGSADPSSLLLIEVDGSVLDPVFADEDGNWSVDLEDLEDGEYAISVTVIDAAGNESEPIAGPELVIDTSIPEDANVELVHDAANDTGADATDSFTANSRPYFTGEAEAYASIEVDVGGVTGGTVADAAGRWRYRPEMDLPDGEHVPVVVVLDRAGNESDGIEGEPVVIDTMIDELTGGLLHDDENDTGVSAEDGFTANTWPLLGGTAEAGAAVEVSLNGITYRSDADDDGVWTVAVEEDTPLADGEYTPRISATDRAGNAVAITGEPFTVDTRAGLGLGDLSTPVVFQIGEVVDYDPVAGISSVGALAVEDYFGGLAEGLEIDEETGHIVGTPTAAGLTFIAMTATGLTGAEETSYFQLAVTTEVKTSNTVNNLDTDELSAAEKPNTYLGTDQRDVYSVYASTNDVILAGAGDDEVRVFFPDTGLGFGRIDGGGGIDKLLVYGNGVEIDFAEFSHWDGANAQVIGHVENFFFAGKETTLSVNAADLFHLQSNALDTDNLHALIRFMTSSANGGEVNIGEGLAQVGEPGAFGASGGPSSGASDHFTKFAGMYTDMAGDHWVTLLVQNGLVIA